AGSDTNRRALHHAYGRAGHDRRRCAATSSPPECGQGGGRRASPGILGRRRPMSLEPVPPPPTFSRLGRIGAILAIVVVAGVAVVGGASFLGRQVGGLLGSGPRDTSEVEPGIPVEVVIPNGASAQDISAILAGQGV